MTLRAPLWLVSILLAAVLLAGCAKEPPAMLSATMTDKIDAVTKAPLTPLSSFAKDASLLYVSTLIQNPVKGTVVEARWLYDKDAKGVFANVDTATVTFTEGARQKYVAFSLQATTTFPSGAYKVQLYLDGKMVKELPFTVQ